MNSKNVSRSSSPRMPSSSVFITLFACSCSSSEVACSSFVFSSRNLENMFNRSACSSNSLINMVMPVVSIARLMPFHDATIVYFCLAVSGNRASVGGGPHASRLGTLLLFELLPLLPLASFVNSQPMFPPFLFSPFFVRSSLGAFLDFYFLPSHVYPRFRGPSSSFRKGSNADLPLELACCRLSRQTQTCTHGNSSSSSTSSSLQGCLGNYATQHKHTKSWPDMMAFAGPSVPTVSRAKWLSRSMCPARVWTTSACLPACPDAPNLGGLLFAIFPEPFSTSRATEQSVA
uniref:Putative secreted protein n=1 Tax=Anopheles triannulatus TaxID=58253 RepID=A0A2M4B3Q0_9DIPT